MIYLDNAATTKICEKAVKAMEPYLKEEYGNPSGIYSIGRKTREQVEKVRWTQEGCKRQAGKLFIGRQGGWRRKARWRLQNRTNYEPVFFAETRK